jgi:tetrahydromethanopterin S-methyltransferase subunit G
MARRAQRDDDVDLLNQAQLVATPFALAYLGCVLATAVVFITWLYRARKNLDAFPEATPTMKAGWAIGGWFIPFANLVIPCRVAASVARESLGGAGLAYSWWVVWLVANVVDRGLARDNGEFDALPTRINGPEDYQEYIHYYGNQVGRGIPGLLLEVVAGILLAILVIKVSRAQENRIAAGTPPPVMPGMVVAPSPYPPQPPQAVQPPQPVQPSQPVQPPPAADPWQSGV